MRSLGPYESSSEETIFKHLLVPLGTLSTISVLVTSPVEASRKQNLCPPAADSVGDFLEQFGAFDFGGSKLDWEDRDRWVKEALDQAYQALERSDKEVNLFGFQNYCNVLAIQWAPDYLKDPANIGNLNAYATFTEYLSRYLGVKQDLITAIADLNRNYAILNRVDPRQLTGPFQLETSGQTKSYRERAAGAVEKHTGALMKAID